MHSKQSRVLSVLAATPTPAGESNAAKPETASKRRGKRNRSTKRPAARVQARTVAQRTAGTTRTVAATTVPRGGVGAGAGGTAPTDTSALLLGLAGGALALIASGGGLIAVARRP